MTNIRFERKRTRASDLFYRSNPLVLIFFIAIIVLILGMMFSFLSLFVWIAWTILAVYIIFFIIWLMINKWW